ncbi:SDR family oxidoreductase [Sphingobium indicum]|uniref:Oxidoreductase n=2 Tax=Sphingobium indicum TaxID=332055 RepID=A0A1L5BQM0_SPHIB|nr:SDR family oxidoreductase [Sphingobium indicum]APL95173.1 oxidoreductase [Sphingobium indicum B90A]KEY97104.1 oxidoreductase [Sphingomonas sp. BHC-A]NYI23453.1 NAD(P)-dependent dehydrogenase (short-subunit alcohol dehydrogenase family) [Sphingobium indicum]RYM01679.1 SDR family oxidoreductase [Sphingobium indicum]
MTGRFHGKSVVVTGAGSGIGRATARLFAGEGARVIAFDLFEGVEETAAGQERIVAMRGDAGSAGDVQALIAAAVRDLGGVDIIAANAGISGGLAGLFEQTAEDWAKILEVNLIGPFLAIRHGAEAMINAGRPGSIICTASVAGLRAGAGGPAYSASKAGVINLVQTAAQQLTGTGIRVNAVCPGLVETGMTQSLYDAARAKGREEMIGQLNPTQRGGEPGELAEAIAFLASDQASYINGHALVVDGGLSTSHPFAKPRRLGVTTF